MAVLHQYVAKIAEFGFLPMPFAIQPRLRIRFRCMRLIPAPLASKLTGVAIPAIFLLEALLAGPSLDQRAVHAEVLFRQMRLGLRQHPREELPRNLLVQQAIDRKSTRLNSSHL